MLLSIPRSMEADCQRLLTNFSCSASRKDSAKWDEASMIGSDADAVHAAEAVA
jgi:hypothetical protein